MWEHSEPFVASMVAVGVFKAREGIGAWDFRFDDSEVKGFWRSGFSFPCHFPSSVPFDSPV